jgi:hypothetical protein
VQKHGAPPERKWKALWWFKWSRENAISGRKAEPILHLSRRLSPVLTLEMLASIEDARNGLAKKSAPSVSEHIRKSLEERLARV